MLSQIKLWIFRKYEKEIQQKERELKIQTRISKIQGETIEKLQNKIIKQNTIIMKLKEELKNTTYKWS